MKLFRTVCGVSWPFLQSFQGQDGLEKHGGSRSVRKSPRHGRGQILSPYMQRLLTFLFQLCRNTTSELPFTPRKPLRDSPGTIEQTEAFEVLKTVPIKPPVLKLPKSDQPYSVDMNECNHQFGYDLHQPSPNGTIHTIAFRSRSLTPSVKSAPSARNNASPLYGLYKYYVPATKVLTSISKHTNRRRNGYYLDPIIRGA